MSDGASPLPLGKQAKSELNTKESRMVDTILERIYAKGRKTANAFAEFDVDHTGKLSVDQLASALQRWGLTYNNDEIGKLVDKYSENGLVDFRQFSRMLQKQPPFAEGDDARTYETPRSPFAQLDGSIQSARPATTASTRDSNATKDAAVKQRVDDALYTYLDQKGLSFTEAVRALFAQCDKSRKGWLSYADFKRGLPSALNIEISEGEFNRLIAKADVKSEGRIDFLHSSHSSHLVMLSNPLLMMLTSHPHQWLPLFPPGSLSRAVRPRNAAVGNRTQSQGKELIFQL